LCSFRKCSSLGRLYKNFSVIEPYERAKCEAGCICPKKSHDHHEPGGLKIFCRILGGIKIEAVLDNKSNFKIRWLKEKEQGKKYFYLFGERDTTLN